MCVCVCVCMSVCVFFSRFFCQYHKAVFGIYMRRALVIYKNDSKHCNLKVTYLIPTRKK